VTRVALLALAAGCGRFSFDAASDAAATADARVCTAIDPFDEDGDGINDTCDVCPFLPDPMQLDRDGDGLGDACEYALDTDSPRQRIRFFDGFNSVRSEWDYSEPLSNGQRPMANTGTHLMFTGTTWVFMISGTITSVSATPQLYISGRVGPGEMYYAELIDEGMGRRRSLMHQSPISGYTELDGLTNNGVAIVPGPFRMRLGIRADRMEGEIMHADDTVVFDAPGTPTINTTECYVNVGGVSLVLDWAAWIETF